MARRGVWAAPPARRAVWCCRSGAWATITSSAATQIRVLAGIVGFSLLFVALGWWPQVRAALADRRALAYTATGAFFGPFLGVSLSLFAVQHAPTGVAASLMAISPLLIIPVAMLRGEERVGLGGIAGALLAVGGVALLFS